MTTVVDPAGTPAPVYNRSGVTISDVIAAGQFGGPGSATPITSYSGVTIALVTEPDSSNFGVVLPSAAEVGDVVEVYLISGSVALWVWADTGDSVNGSGSVSGNRWIFRKVAANTWFSIGA